MNTYYWLVTLTLCMLTIITRALPFITADLMTDRLNKLGKYLPAYIMMLLVIYEIDIRTITHPPYGLPELLALAVLLAVHLLLRNTIISLIVSTSFYLLII